MAANIMTFLKFAVFATLAYTTVVDVGGDESVTTQGLPFCHEITPAPLNPCTSSPCVTGNCTNLGNGQFECLCTEGWHGDLCDTGFLCGDAQNICLPFSAICNQTRECSNRFDESHCCGDSFSEYRCGGPPYCLLSDKVCNGEEDCSGTGSDDETFYCGNTCTITASPILSTATPTTIACITTPISSTVVSQSPAATSKTSDTAYSMASTSSNAVQEGNSFLDETKNVAAIAASLGFVASCGAAYVLATKFYKAKPV